MRAWRWEPFLAATGRPMPELPEVESARTVIERAAPGHCTTTVDDSDSYVRRPHLPGQIRDALVARRLVTACRLGSLWCPTSPMDGSVAEGPPLGIRLGMSGKTVIADGTEIDGGDYWEGRSTRGVYRWSRVRLTFDDGGMLMLVDPVGWAESVSTHRSISARTRPPSPTHSSTPPSGTAARRSRRVYSISGALAGIGNLLADEILWHAALHPTRGLDDLRPAEQHRLLDGRGGPLRRRTAGRGAHAYPHPPPPARRPNARTRAPRRPVAPSAAARAGGAPRNRSHPPGSAPYPAARTHVDRPSGGQPTAPDSLLDARCREPRP